MMWDRKWPAVIGSAAGVVDRALVAAIKARARYDREHKDTIPQAERLERLAETHRVYEGDAFIADPATFFPVPPALDLPARLVRPGVWELAWASTFEPFLQAVAERWLSRVENRTARARVYVGGAARNATLDAITQRPAVIAVHGYLGGHWLLEENQWPIEWLVRRGLDVVLPVLPHHAGRAGMHRGNPTFPNSDPRMTVEGFRQAVADIRSLVRWLRQRGAPHVGVIGMSLGGYTSALVATLTDEIDFVMPLVPLASLADFAREQGRLVTGEGAVAHHAAVERAHWVVSPLARGLRLPASRALVVAAEHDHVTPVAHAGRIATHFDCELLTIGGGHLVQLGRSSAFRSLASMLERDGIIPPVPPARARR